VVEDDGGVVADLRVLGAVEGQSLVHLEVALLFLLLAGGEEVVDLRVDARADLQLVHEACRAVVGVEIFGVSLEAHLFEPAHVGQVFLGIGLEDEVLPNVLPHEHVAAGRVCMARGVRSSGEQNSPPQAHEEMKPDLQLGSASQE